MVIFFTLWLKKIVDSNTKSFKFLTNANVGEIKIESIIMMIRNLNNWYPVNTVFDHRREGKLCISYVLSVSMHTEIAGYPEDKSECAFNSAQYTYIYMHFVYDCIPFSGVETMSLCLMHKCAHMCAQTLDNTCAFIFNEEPFYRNVCVCDCH